MSLPHHSFFFVIVSFSGRRMTSPIARSVWVNLYKQLEREAAKFPQYNYREFAKRRIREHFEANRGVTDPVRQEQLLKVSLFVSHLSS
ncbi:complex 1 protein [Cooperia oncophora]